MGILKDFSHNDELNRASENFNQIKQRLNFIPDLAYTEIENSNEAFLDLGVKYREKGDFKKALYYYKHCILSSFEENPDSPEIAISFNDIALILSNQKETKKALNFYNLAIENSLKNGNENTSIYFSNLGDFQRKQGNYSEALINFEKSLALKTEMLEKGHQEIAFGYHNVGLCHQNLNNVGLAIENFEKCLAINLNIHGPNHEYVGISHITIGECLIEKKQYQRAITHLEQGIKTNPGGAFPFKIAQCYNSIGDKEKALEYFIASAEIRKERLGVNHASTIKTVLKAKETNEELGNFDIGLPSWFDDVN